MFDDGLRPQLLKSFWVEITAAVQFPVLGIQKQDLKKSYNNLLPGTKMTTINSARSVSTANPVSAPPVQDKLQVQNQLVEKR